MSSVQCSVGQRLQKVETSWVAIHANTNIPNLLLQLTMKMDHFLFYKKEKDLFITISEHHLIRGLQKLLH